MERINDRLVPPPSGDWRFRLLPTALLGGDGVDHRYTEARHSNIAKTSRSNGDWWKFVYHRCGRKCRLIADSFNSGPPFFSSNFI
jgi:hypothetical protein